jgi:uncharacterized protein (TIGR02145 family)
MMKKNIFLLLIAATTVTMNLQAQVKIGKDEVPAKGALLDLNNDEVKGGLLLPNVEIDELNEIPDDFTDTDVHGPGPREELAGLIVYNTKEDTGKGIEKGLYVWDGTKWNKLGCGCNSKADPENFPKGSVADGIWQGKTYFDIAITEGTTSELRGSLTPRQSWEQTVFNNRQVQGIGSGITAATRGTEGGHPVYSGVQLYRFTPNGTVSNVRFDYVETKKGEGKRIVKSITPVQGTAPYSTADYSGEIQAGTACYAKMEYEESLDLDLIGIARDDAWTANLYVIYNNGTEDVTQKLTTHFQDAAICGAMISSTEWKSFQCHNLGADIWFDPFPTEITRELHGDWYRFGAPVASMYNTPENDTRDNDTWDNTYCQYDDNDWDPAKDPCPQGWRLPSIDEWSNVLTNNAIGTFPLDTPLTTSFFCTGCFNAGLTLGEHLQLPFAGVRDIAVTFGLIGRGMIAILWASNHQQYGYADCLWSVPSIETTTNHGGEMNEGIPVRCIAE